MSNLHQRREHVRDIVSRNHVTTQEQILALLAAEGLTTNQATLSRDLRELGIRKLAGGYALPDKRPASPGRRRALRSDLRGNVVRAERSGPIVVIRTRAGAAEEVARTLEDADLHEVLGAVAWRETVFVATQTAAQARNVLKLLTA